MFPTILFSNNQDSFEKYISELKKSDDISDTQVQRLSPEKASITIGQIRELKKELSITTSKPRLIIFESFNNSTIEAQNALLKVLEEYNKNNQFIMFVDQINTVLPTIISRSRVLYLEKEKAVVDETTMQVINTFLEKPSVRFLSHSVFTLSSKEEAGIMLRLCIQAMREKMQHETYYAQLIKDTFNLLYKLEHNNLSPQLTVDNWLISVIKSKSA